jgi:ketosteroid isomerase-like protein
MWWVAFRNAHEQYEQRMIMAEVASTESLRVAERRLQKAQLAGDVDALDQLLDERLIFTGGPDGGRYSKADDLAGHRSRTQVMTKVAEEALDVLVDGSTGVTWFLGTLEGTYAATPFAVRLRYTRTWIHDTQRGWRIVAAHSSPAV